MTQGQDHKLNGFEIPSFNLFFLSDQMFLSNWDFENFGTENMSFHMCILIGLILFIYFFTSSHKTAGLKELNEEENSDFPSDELFVWELI